MKQQQQVGQILLSVTCSLPNNNGDYYLIVSVMQVLKTQEFCWKKCWQLQAALCAEMLGFFVRVYHVNIECLALQYMHATSLCSSAQLNCCCFFSAWMEPEHVCIVILFVIDPKAVIRQEQQEHNSCRQTSSKHQCPTRMEEYHYLTSFYQPTHPPPPAYSWFCTRSKCDNLAQILNPSLGPSHTGEFEVF